MSDAWQMLATCFTRQHAALTPTQQRMLAEAWEAQPVRLGDILQPAWKRDDPAGGWPIEREIWTVEYQHQIGSTLRIRLMSVKEPASAKSYLASLTASTPIGPPPAPRSR